MLSTNHNQPIRFPPFPLPKSLSSMAAALVLVGVSGVAVRPANAAAPQKTLYVSKLGDNSDGRSWATAFGTIQKALLAIPDASGGYRIAVRPDTYVEANLYPAFKGAAGAYNTPGRQAPAERRSPDGVWRGPLEGARSWS